MYNTLENYHLYYSCKVNLSVISGVFNYLEIYCTRNLCKNHVDVFTIRVSRSACNANIGVLIVINLSERTEYKLL